MKPVNIPVDKMCGTGKSVENLPPILFSTDYPQGKILTLCGKRAKSIYSYQLGC